MPKTDRDSESATSSYCFTWDNYQNHLSQVVRQLLDEGCMVDVTLYAGGVRLQAHRLVLCVCSDLFADLFSQVNDEHVTVILGDIDPKDVKAILDFIYNGEVRTPVENINNFLGAAQSLRIQGLMDLGPMEENKCVDYYEDIELFDDYMQDDDEDGETEKTAIDSSTDTKNSIKDGKANEDDSDHRERKRRKSVNKKEYTDEMLVNAINDIKAGNSLLDAAAKFHIPRSTLYMRAKVLGLSLNNHKCEYTVDDMKAAIEAVIAGSSLQNAADTFGIPKTVLWRRIQKEGHVYRTENRRTYDADKREAAIKALERGEALTKVAQEYQIPKTTLFRDKVRLVDEGKLPETDWKKRKSYVEGEKRILLEKAVAACKKGDMSQATASMKFNIPKTTIWRRLQRDAAKAEDASENRKIINKKGQIKVKKNDNNKTEDVNEPNFEVYCEDDSEMSISYIDDPNLADDPELIVLSSGTANELNLQNNQIIVMPDGSEANFIACDIDLDEHSPFNTKS